MWLRPDRLRGITQATTWTASYYLDANYSYAAGSQLDTDGDGSVDGSGSSGPDFDNDADGVYNAEEDACTDAAAPFDFTRLHYKVRPERTDSVFAGQDEDGDSMTDEALPSGAAAYDCDGDGFTGRAESGTPLCSNSVNDDSFDDSVVNDGCPGGPAQVGSHSEASFQITTNDQDACGYTGYPLDLIPGGFQPNTINIQDIASFIAPVRKYTTKPGDANFDERWDVIPGTTFGAAWININDLAAFVSETTTGKPPMHGGQRTYNRVCPWSS